MQPLEAKTDPPPNELAAGMASTGYVAFISYAREDEAFAQQLETEIEAQPRPGGNGQTCVFRDHSDFTGSSYEAALEGHLRNSASLIVLCSPHARRSNFVGDEIERFANLVGPTRIFPVLVSGLPDNEADDLKAFPSALVKVTRDLGMPLGAEYRGIDLKRERLSRGRFEAEWYKLLGNLFDQPAALIREHDQQRIVAAQRRRMAAGAGVVMLLVAVAATMGWLKHRADIAEKRASDMSAKTQTLLAELERERSNGSETASALQGNRAPALVPAPATGPLVRPAPQPRVYVHIVIEEQRRLAVSLQTAIERSGLGVVVPGIQRLEVGPTKSSELRYFHENERDEAERIGQVLRGAGATDLAVKKVPGYETSTKIRPRHYELWLKPDN